MDWKLELVVVPVSDVALAKAFYMEKVGFNEDLDHRGSDEFHVVQLTPPGSTCSTAIGIGLSDMPPGSVKGLQLVVSDIEAAHAELVERGVEVSEIQHFDGRDWKPGGSGDWNSFVFFSDPDGNGWAVQKGPGRG
jgi:catechol 2,3-dioxygenase-like lactoylglutathione lyase family enzyme